MKNNSNPGTTLLIDFILRHHHEYLRAAIPQIRELLDLVGRIHPDHKHLEDIRHHLDILSEDLIKHLAREEDVFFPALVRLSETADWGCHRYPLFQALQPVIALMQHEHRCSEELIHRIRILSNAYTVPPTVCPTYHLVYKLLEEFDHKVTQHIDLENTVLFPKVISMFNPIIST